MVTRTLYNESQPNPATLSYDLLNHFIEWQDTDPNTGITTSQWNLYDANGERMLQRDTNNGTTTLTVYPFGNEEYHYTAGGTLQSSLHYDDLGGQLLDERSGSTTTMLLTDALGSVISTFSNTRTTLPYWAINSTAPMAPSVCKLAHRHQHQSGLYRPIQRHCNGTGLLRSAVL